MRPRNPQWQPATPATPTRTGGRDATADGVPLSGWWRRAIATVVDNLVVSLLSIVALQVFVNDFTGRWQRATEAYVDALVANPQTAAPSADFQHLATLVTVATGILTLVYGIALIAGLGATVGQKVVGIRFSPLDRGKEKLPIQQVVLRVLAWTLLSASGAPLLAILQVLNVTMPLWHAKRQSLVDLLARTQVVRTRARDH